MNQALAEGMFLPDGAKGMGRVDSKIISIDGDAAGRVMAFVEKASRAFENGRMSDGQAGVLSDPWGRFSAKFMQAVHAVIFADENKRFIDLFSPDFFDSVPMTSASIATELMRDKPNSYTYRPDMVLDRFVPRASGLGRAKRETNLIFDRENGILRVLTKGGLFGFAIPATSGKGGCMNNPECEGKKDVGPLPRGDYLIDLNAEGHGLSDPSPVWDVLRRARGDWGDWRAPLIPQSNTKKYGRNNFFLHGGDSPGSRGCIDVGGELKGSYYTDLLKSFILRDTDGKLYVTVK